MKLQLLQWPKNDSRFSMLEMMSYRIRFRLEDDEQRRQKSERDGERSRRKGKSAKEGRSRLEWNEFADLVEVEAKDELLEMIRRLLVRVRVKDMVD